MSAADLTCSDEPRGQLPPGTSNQVAAQRITDIDEAGEDCRQKVHRAHDKMEVYESIVDQLNAHAGMKKDHKHGTS